MRKRYPIGIQSFEKIRTENFYYEDKRRFVEELVSEGAYYFLSRPEDLESLYFLTHLSKHFSEEKSFLRD